MPRTIWFNAGSSLLDFNFRSEKPFVFIVMIFSLCLKKCFDNNMVEYAGNNVADSNMVEYAGNNMVHGNRVEYAGNNVVVYSDMTCAVHSH